MKIGAVYPQIETGGDPAALDGIGRAVEQLGYDHLLMYDHVVGAAHGDRDPPLNGPYNEKDPFHDPFVAFAYLAGITRTIDFFTGVLILPQRQTVLVAKQAADLDLLSGGRLNLGVGTGWNYVEYRALGANFEARGAMLDEQIPYLRRLWGEDLVSFEGRFHSLDRGGLLPRPKRRIPILLGGFADVALRRAAKLGDGFIFPGELDAHALPALARTRELLGQGGRSEQEFHKHYIVQSPSNDPIAGAVDGLRRWRDAGGDAGSVMTMGLGFREWQEHVAFLAEVKQRLDS